MCQVSMYAQDHCLSSTWQGQSHVAACKRNHSINLYDPLMLTHSSNDNKIYLITFNCITKCSTTTMKLNRCGFAQLLGARQVKL